MSVNLSPLAGAGAQFFTDSGTPLTGGLLYTYSAGTTTPRTTYTDNIGATANSNPIVLDAAGRVPYEIWLLFGLNYKFVLKTSVGVTIGTWDNISGVNGSPTATSFYADAFTATAGQVLFTLSANPGSINNLDVSLDGSTLVAGDDFSWSGISITLNTPAFVSQRLRVAYSTVDGVQAISPGSVIDNSVAVGTDLYNRIHDTVSVKDFGAVGDGVTDDTAAIQAALSTGKNVTGVSGETYSIRPLTQNTARQVIDMRGCTLVLRPAQSSYMLSVSGTGAQVLGGVWDGNKAAGQSTTDGYYDHAAVCLLANYGRVEGVKSQNSAGIGIKGVLCSYTLVVNCEVTAWNVQGIYIESPTADAYGNRIESNVVTVGTGTGVGIYLIGQGTAPYTYKQRRWIVANNVVTGPTNPTATDIGITCRAVDGVVSGNVVTDCDLGISLDITTRTVVSGNRVEFTGTPATGYCYEINGADNIFTGNFAKGGEYGISSSGPLELDGNTITGNVFELQTVNAIYFAPGAATANYLTISGNTFNFAGAGAARRAIYLTNDCRYATITGNNFIGPGSGVVGGRGVFLDTGYGEVQICSNRFQGWERPVGLYSAGASTYTNVMLNGNDCSKDMINEASWLSLEGSAAYGTGIRQMWNSDGAAAGYSELNYIDRKTNLLMLWSANGTPESAVTAAVGSLYMNTAGGAGTVLYVKQTGTGNTGWGAK